MKERMKIFNVPYVALILVVAVSLLAFKEAHTTSKTHFQLLKEDLTEAKFETLQLMEAMPHEYYDFRPKKSLLPFRDQAHEVIHSIEFLALEAQDSNSEWSPDHEYVTAKKDLIELTESSFAYLEGALEQSPQGEGLNDELASFLTENAKQRAQLEMYLIISGWKK